MVKINDYDQPLMALLSKHEDSMPYDKIPKNLVISIGLEKLSVRCGKVYKITDSGIENRYGSDWAAPTLAWLYKLGLITMKNNRVSFTDDWFALISFVKKTNVISS